MDHISYKFMKRLPKAWKLVGELRQAAAVIDETIRALKKHETVRLGEGEPLDPLHTVYTAIQHAASIFAERVSVLDEFEPYYDIVTKAEDEYMPSGPPMSPLTRIYFTAWASLTSALDPTRRQWASACWMRARFSASMRRSGFDKNLLRVVSGKSSWRTQPVGLS